MRVGFPLLQSGPLGSSSGLPSILPGLAAYWSMNEASGTRSDSLGVLNLSEFGGVINSGVGIIGNASVFTGSAVNYLRRISFTTLSNVSAFTISTWFYTNSGVSHNNTMSEMFRCDGSTGQVLVQHQSVVGGAGVRVSVGSANRGLTPLVSSDAWHHVGIVFDGSLSGNINRLKIWVDGVSQTLVYSGTIPGVTPTETVTLRLGQSHDGRLDEVGLWLRSLEESEILRLYNGGLGLAYPF